MLQIELKAESSVGGWCTRAAVLGSKQNHVRSREHCQVRGFLRA